LPRDEASSVPREKPIPLAKPLTPWQEFAREKGIVKNRRSKKVWDDSSQDWRYRVGPRSANNPLDQWVIEDDGTKWEEGEDPFFFMKKAKKERTEKQRYQQERNWTIAKEKGQQELAKGAISVVHAKKGRALASEIDRAVRVAQKSTASMGTFDKARSGEFPIKRKRQVAYTSIEKETESQLKVFNKIIKQKDREGTLYIDKGVRQIQTEDTLSQKKRRRSTQEKKTEQRSKKFRST